MRTTNGNFSAASERAVIETTRSLGSINLALGPDAKMTSREKADVRSQVNRDLYNQGIRASVSWSDSPGYEGPQRTSKTVRIVSDKHEKVVNKLDAGMDPGALGFTELGSNEAYIRLDRARIEAQKNLYPAVGFLNTMSNAIRHEWGHMMGIEGYPSGNLMFHPEFLGGFARDDWSNQIFNFNMKDLRFLQGTYGM